MVLAATGVMMVSALLLSTAAVAATGYGIVSSFGSFGNVQGIAVEESTGDVYVYDASGGGSIYKFDSTGKPVNFSALGSNVIVGVGASGGAENEIAVSPAGVTAGDIYVAHFAGSVAIYGPDGKPVEVAGKPAELNGGGPGWRSSCGVATDPAGHVYVSLASGYVDRYAPTVNPVKNTDYTSSLYGIPTEPCNIAVDSAESVYEVKWSVGPVTKYEASQFNTTGQAAVGTLFDSQGSTLAVDPLTGEVYVDEVSAVSRLDSSGTVLASTAGDFPGISGSYGVAVDGSTGVAYVSIEGGAKVGVLGSGALPVAPVTKPAGEVMATTAVLHGELNPKGSEVGFYFSYDTGGSCTGAGSVTTPLDNGGNPAKGAIPVEESALITGLEPNKHYTFCLFAVNPFGTTEGSSEPFTTLGSSPAVDSESASDFTSTTGMLAAQINPENQETTYSFQYATNEALAGATTIPGGSIPAGFGDQPASSSIGGGLKPGTTYYYQAVAKNATGTTYGTVQSFTSVPEPLTEAATELTGTTAVLGGTLIQGLAEGEASYRFEYNTGASCGGQGAQTTTTGTIAKAAKEAVKTEIKGLSPRTQYTFCLIASNPFGSSDGAPVSLLTVAGKPIVEAQSASEQMTSTVKLTATINPSGAETTCRVQYGLTSAYGSEESCAAGLGEGVTGQSVSVTLSALLPDQTYHYRFLASNEAGEGEGTDQTFQTLMVPPTIAQAPTAPVVGRVNVLLSGMANPENTLLFYHFIYGTTTEYGSSTPVTEGGTGLGVEEISQVLEGLEPGTTYHYALVVSNPAGSETSVDSTFRTGPSTPPSALTGPASSITTTSATLTGTANPNSLPTTYTFQIGTDTTYGGELSGVAGSGPEAVPVSATFHNLQPGTTYHYRLLAANQDGTSYGQDMTFTTLGLPSSLTAPASPLLITVPSIAFPAEAGVTSEPQQQKTQKKKKKAKPGKHRKKVRHGRSKS